MRDARRLVSSALGVWGLEEVEAAAWLVVSELMTNAVEHARMKTVRVTVTRLDQFRVRVAVVDRSKDLPQARAASLADEAGRGLELVAALCDGRWGTDTMRWGKRVWGELAATGGEAR